MPTDTDRTTQEKFGRDLAVKLVEFNERAPVRVAVMELEDKSRILEVRRMYYKGGKLRFGKAVRLRLGTMLQPSEFSDVMNTIEMVLTEATGDASDYWDGFPEPWADDKDL